MAIDATLLGRLGGGGGVELVPLSITPTQPGAWVYTGISLSITARSFVAATAESSETLLYFSQSPTDQFSGAIHGAGFATPGTWYLHATKFDAGPIQDIYYIAAEI